MFKQKKNIEELVRILTVAKENGTKGEYVQIEEVYKLVDEIKKIRESNDSLREKSCDKQDEIDRLKEEISLVTILCEDRLETLKGVQPLLRKVDNALKKGNDTLENLTMQMELSKALGIPNVKIFKFDEHA